MSKNRRAPLTDEQKQARRAAERELMAQAVKALQTSTGWQQWLAVRRHFRTYSLSNQLLLALQRPTATRVAGFRAWLTLGHCVRRGEKALRIWAPVPPSKKAIEQWTQAGADPRTRPRTHFRLTAVFDRDQTEPLPDFPGGPVALDPPIIPIDGDQLAHLLQPLTAFAGSIGSQVTIEPVPGGAHGFYELDTRRIVIDVTGPAMTPNAQVKTLLHELAHALVRADHQPEDPDLTRAEQECVAETVAHCVCASAGLDTTGYSTAYLATWSQRAATDAINHHAALIDRLARRLEQITDQHPGTDEPSRSLQAA